MAQKPESKVKHWLYGTKQKPGILFQLFPGAYVYKPPGGMFGVAGTPDCFCLWGGVFIAIEIKAEGNTPTTLQLHRLNHISDQGGVAACLIGRDLDKMQAIKAAVMAKVIRYGA